MSSEGGRSSIELVVARNWAEFWNLQLQNNGKKGIRRCKEDFMCGLK
jgi:hypothetical protein